MHLAENLSFVNPVKGRTSLATLCVALLFCVVTGFLLPGEALGGGQPSSLLAPPLPGERTGNPQPAIAVQSSLPSEALPSISSALGRDLPSYQTRASRTGFEADNERHKLAATFTAQGVEVRSGSQCWRIALRGYGYGDAITAVHTAVPIADFNRVEYRRGVLTEWYVNGPLGLEQGITLQDRPGQADGRPLTVALALEGDLSATVDEGGTGLTLSNRKGQPELRYKGLFAYDATGRKLPARMEVRGARLLLEVEDTTARYPVVIDPYVQLAMLTNTGAVANQELGASVSISGNTAVAGAPCPACTILPSAAGAAYVFVESPTGWANMTQTAKLTATTSDQAMGNNFGFAVSISGDTIVVGANGTNGGHGAAYVFVEPTGGWADMTETAKLTASDSTVGQLLGRSVSISGNTVVAGSPADTVGTNLFQGAAYVFVEPTGGWAGNLHEAAKLIASDGVRYGELGYSVGIDGNTVVAGQPSPDTSKIPPEHGTAYVFVEPTGGWASVPNMTQTAELTASDGVNGDRLGNFVAVSGNTIVAGAPLATVGSVFQQGAAYVFVEPTGGWANMTQTAKLTSTDGTKMGRFGRAVAISGNNVVVGAPSQTVGSDTGQGAAYIFVKPTGGWVNMTQTDELDITNGGTNDDVGCRVGISGTTAVIGALGEGGNKQGAAFIFVP
jgi:trimeric autotransporter adhesin